MKRLLKATDNIFKKDKLYLIILTVVIWRIYLFLIAYFAKILIPQFITRFPYVEVLKNSGLPYWVWSFGNFDGVHYIRIAKDGYAYQFTQAFFPMYPILIKLVSFITFGNYLVAALLISNTCFLIAVILFYKITKNIFNQSIAFWSCLFIIFSPTSFYFASVYTESLFFLLVILSFYFYEKENYILSSIFGAFSSLTRLIGIYLSVVLTKIAKRKNYFSLFIVPFGLIVYMLYLKITFDNPIYFLTAQSAFGQERSTTNLVLLPQVFYRSIQQMFTTHGFVLFNSTFDFISTLICLILLLYSFKMVRKSWVIFSLLAVLTPTLTGSLISMPRYIIIAFPMYIVVASINNIWIKVILLVLSIGLLAITTTFFTRGYWIA